jgi:AcrR family transcriptional regulator
MKNKNEKLRILNFSDQYFRKKGLYKTSMDEIAGQLKISKKTIYKYFPSKEALVSAAVAHMLLSSEARVSKIVNSKKSAIEKFVELLSEYSSEMCGACDLWVNDLQHHYPEVWEMIDGFRTEKVYEFAKKLLKQGRKEKIIANYPPEIILELYAAGIRAVVNPEFLLQNNFSMHKALETVYNIYLNAILTEEGKSFFNKIKKDKNK